MRASLLLCLAALLIATVAVSATINTGELSSDGFAFGSKFCYHDNGQSKAGSMRATLTLPQSAPGKQPNITMMFYDDQSIGGSVSVGSWPELLENWDSWTCQQKADHSKNMGIGLQPTSVVLAGTEWTIEFYAEFEQAARPRYWFFNFVNCGAGFNNAKYTIHAVQLGESSWNEEFGSNENGLNSLYLAFFFLFTIVLGTNLYGTYRLQQKLQYLHPMIKLFLIVLIIEYLSIFVLLLHYGSYANNGVGIVLLMKLGEVLAIVSRCFFMVLLLLLAKGWTISNETLTHKWAVIGLVFAYLGMSIIMLIYSFTLDNPMLTHPTTSVEVMTIFQNLIWLVFAVWFTFHIFYYSYRQEQNPAKKSMYLKLGGIFSIWFFLPPLISLAVFAVDPWARDRAVAFLTVTITTAAYAVLVFLFWPSRAEEYFSIATPDVMTGRDEHYSQL